MAKCDHDSDPNNGNEEIIQTVEGNIGGDPNNYFAMWDPVKNYQFVIKTGEEAFELEVIFDGGSVGKFRVEMAQLIQIGEIEEDIDLSDDQNTPTGEKVRMYFKFERSWC